MDIKNRSVGCAYLYDTDPSGKDYLLAKYVSELKGFEIMTVSRLRLPSRNTRRLDGRQLSLGAFTRFALLHAKRQRFSKIILFSGVGGLEFCGLHTLVSKERLVEASVTILVSEEFSGEKPLIEGVFGVNEAKGVSALLINMESFNDPGRRKPAIVANDETWNAYSEHHSELALLAPGISLASTGTEDSLASPRPLPIKTASGAWLETPRDRKSRKDKRRVAFLFLTRKGLRNSGLWRAYVRSHSGLCNTYQHCSDPTDLPEWEREIIVKDPIPTKWGDISLVRATLLLLEEALNAKDNQFFILASESCLPIVPLAELHRRCLINNRSLIAFESRNRLWDRAPDMADRDDGITLIPDRYKYFHPQWLMLNRTMAEFYTVNNLTHLFENHFGPDETYFGTVAAAAGTDFSKHITCHPVTWCNWQKPYDSHPEEFAKAPKEKIITAVNKGHLLARKFGELTPRDRKFFQNMLGI